MLQQNTNKAPKNCWLSSTEIGNTQTGVLVGYRQSHFRDPSFTQSDRAAWLKDLISMAWLD